MKLSMFLIVHNEKERVKSFPKWARRYADQLILIDDCSDDGTKDIASELDFDKIYLSDVNYGYCEKHQQRARQMCDNEWILFFDADEFIPEHITPEMFSEAIDSNKNIDAIGLWMIDYLNGEVYQGGQQCFKYRLFKNTTRAHFPATLHSELIGYNNPIQRKQLEFYHWRHDSDIEDSSKRCKAICIKEINEGSDRAKQMYWDLKRHYNWQYHEIEETIRS